MLRVGEMVSFRESAIQDQMFSPGNIHANNLIQTKQAVLGNMQQQLIYEAAMNLKKRKQGRGGGGVGLRNAKGEIL